MTSALIPLLIKGLVGGLFVVGFALVGEVLRPRGLAGIASAGPSIALGGLLVTIIATGAAAAGKQGIGMVAGAVALILWCLVAVDLVKRFGSTKGSLLATVIWFLSAGSIWAVALR